MQAYTAYFASPIGYLKIEGTDDYVSSVSFSKTFENNPTYLPGCIKECISQLSEYFREERRTFDVPLSPKGTEFQKEVWKKLQMIPHGTAASYKTIADKIGKPKATRAVGNANNKNPLAIIVPCHRVIGSNGKLTGYAGGLWRKDWLLRHEQSAL